MCMGRKDREREAANGEREESSTRRARRVRSNLNVKRIGWKPMPLLAQLHTPIRVVEKRLPALVLLAAEAERDQWVALWFEGAVDEFHSCLLWSSAAFSGVALDAGADEVFPGVAAAVGSWVHVVDGEVACWEDAAAVLALVAVAGEEVAAVEFDVLLGEFVVAQEADDARHGDVHADSLDPVVALGLELALELAEFEPAFEVVVDVRACD